MKTATIMVRTTDIDNGGPTQGPPIKIRIRTGGTPEQIAQRINAAQARATGAIRGREPAPGRVARATGDEYAGAAWIDDHGHQGATSLILVWHDACRPQP